MRHIKLILKITTKNKFYEYSKVKLGTTEFILVNFITQPFKRLAAIVF